MPPKNRQATKKQKREEPHEEEENQSSDDDGLIQKELEEKIKKSMNKSKKKNSNTKSKSKTSNSKTSPSKPATSSKSSKDVISDEEVENNSKKDSFFDSDYEDSSEDEQPKTASNSLIVDIEKFKFFQDYRTISKNEFVRVRGFLKLLFNKGKISMKDARQFVQNGIDGRTPSCNICHIRKYLTTLNGLGDTAKLLVEHICSKVQCPGVEFCGLAHLHEKKRTRKQTTSN